MEGKTANLLKKLRTKLVGSDKPKKQGRDSLISTGGAATSAATPPKLLPMKRNHDQIGHLRPQSEDDLADKSPEVIKELETGSAIGDCLLPDFLKPNATVTEEPINEDDQLEMIQSQLNQRLASVTDVR